MIEIETWERLQARLYHLGWLGEELPAFAATTGGAWLYREIAREAATVATIATAYVRECEKVALARPHGMTAIAGPDSTAGTAGRGDIGAQPQGGGAA